MKAKCSATVDMRFKDLEEIQDLNSDAVACNTFEESLLVSLDNCLHLIDMRDKVLNNEPEIVQARKLVRQAREYNAMVRRKCACLMTESRCFPNIAK